MIKYYCHVSYCGSLPLVVYAFNLKEAKQRLRSKLAVSRLPNGTKLYKQGQLA